MKKTDKPIIVNDLVFAQAFRTEASTSFSISQLGVGLSRGADRGWIDVHWPCEGHAVVYIRGSLPEKYLRFDYLNALTQKLLADLDIPIETSRDVLFFKAENCVSLSYPGASGDNTSDRIEITRSFRLS